MLQDMLLPLVTVGISELGDKTQLAIMSLAARTPHHGQLFLGAVLGFIVSDGAAIVLGNSLSTILPMQTVQLFAGLLFLLFGILTLRGDGERAGKLTVRAPLLSSFTLVVVSEWGDKSQIAAGLFSTTYNPWLVFIGVIAVLGVFTLLSLFFGKALRHLHPRWLKWVSAAVFLGVGIFTLAQINKV
ncbi:MAG TPA: TMEM165/GDT1 family protein [Candidatus Nanoarchaeia archaeon]|nr:TMEM165/GDT1 family protein [Candidatus Nanoarchaeia archaeon]